MKIDLFGGGVVIIHVCCFEHFEENTILIQVPIIATCILSNIFYLMHNPVLPC